MRKRADVNEKRETVPMQPGHGYNRISWDIEISQNAAIQNQTVSSGFTAMTLWPKPLCCLGCKLHVHAESCALTLRGSPNTDSPVFSARQIALCICFTKPKKGRQMSPKPEQSGPLLLGFGSSGRVELK